MARGRARLDALGAGPHQPRPAVPREPVARHRLALPGHRAPDRPRLPRVRAVARGASRRARRRAPSPRQEDRDRDGVAPQGRHRAAQAEPGPPPRAPCLEGGTSHAEGADRHGQHDGDRGPDLGQARDGGGSRLEILRRAGRRAGLLDPHRPRRPRRHRRAQRRGQDDAPQHAHGRPRTRRRPRAPGHESGDRRPRPAARQPRSGTDALGCPIRRWRQGDGRGYDAPRHRLHEGFPVRAGAGAHAGRRAVGRRARPHHAGARAGQTLQPPRPRRADQRPRHRDARPPPGAAGGLCRHRTAGQPRPRLPRPRGHLRRRGRRRRALGRVCRRILRHAGAEGRRACEGGETRDEERSR